MSTELVLIVSDLFIPLRTPDIDTQFKSILVPNKVQHVLCLGNIGNQETYDWLNGLSEDFHEVKGDYDIYNNISEKKAVQIGNFRIGMIHGHQIIPAGDLEVLANIQRELDCDILLSGNTHQINVKVVDNKLFINPGSISGAFSNVVPDPSPSFVLMVLQGTEAIIYLYVLNDRTQKFDVNKIEYTKGAENYRVANDNENENENDNEEEIKEQNQGEEQPQEMQEPEQPQEEREQPQESSE